MKFPVLIAIFGFLLLGGSIFPAMSQSDSSSENVVINEIDINPPGNDSLSVSEWIELYNPTNTAIDIGGWAIASTTVLKQTMIIPYGTTIQPNSFLTYSYKSVWFTDVSELVELRDADGKVIDQTPTITDIEDDFTSWQRIYDGFDTDSVNDWKFVQSNAGSTNGKIAEEIESEKTILTLSIDKQNYIFGETAVITGEVSELLFIEKPFFQAAQVMMKIYGPNGYEISRNLYPDLYLKYETSLSLQEVLGINEGTYYVIVQYGDALKSTQFTVGDEIIIVEEKLDTELSITTDKESYLPGETAIITAYTNEIVPFEGLKFKVTTSNGDQIFDGTLYPDSNGKFTTNIFMTTVAPIYGFNQITAEYSTYSTVTSFELSEDVKEDKPISLFTDKKAYALGETVIITGRVNDFWIFALDLELQQVGMGSLATTVLDRIKILDSVRLEGDSTFRYEFEIADNPKRYGDYTVTVSKDVGSETVTFHVVENPEEFEESSIPFTLFTDKTIYDVGDKIIISGKVKNPVKSSTFQSPVIDIAIKPVDGPTIISTASKPTGFKSAIVFYTLTAVPDTIGNYEVIDTLYNAIYPPGDYLIRATYANGKLFATTPFSVVDPLDIDGPIVTLDKEVYGLGEQVHLTALVPGGGAGKPDFGIVLTKPNGNEDKFGGVIDNGRLSWTWTTPLSETPSVIQNDRYVFSSNYGVYKISLAQSDTAPIIVFFKVSPNPEEDSLNIEPLTVTTEVPVYSAAENQKIKILGTAIKKVQGNQGLVVPYRVDIIIKSPAGLSLDSSSVYLDSGGNFQSLFVMPVTIYKEGIYKVTAVYQGIRAENFFQVDNDFIFGGEEELALVIGSDKDEYHPGDLASISARPTKLVFVETIEVGIPTEEQTKLNCGAFICGIGVPITTLRQDPTGTFIYEHKFPDDAVLGPYIITLNAEFGTFTKQIQLVEKIPVPEESSLGERVIEKFNRITDPEIQITVNKKTVEEKELSPRVIQGSLFTTLRGEEANVNLKISAPDGTCIIGPDVNCLIKDSTRLPGQIYEVVRIDGIDYNVRYNGPDVLLEKYTILPVDSDAFFPDSDWNVEVIKEEQSSRLYYKVTYVVTG
ncbi:hypothetical protein MnTg01_00385 [archaeon MnTg01]|nr:hypothetical protein MnTg01_00385 [archaeon MnTg01]